FVVHGLKDKPTEVIKSWETGSRYAIYNGIGLLALSLHPRLSGNIIAGPAIALGTFLFSGSIFYKAMTKKPERCV
ncbi:hypothetical protein FISHEDRAFT_14757, partial [Fistulina hepatica ATCC 64428]